MRGDPTPDESGRGARTPASPVRHCALVTGASAGIGLAFAQLLAQQGFDLVLVARRRERLESLSAGLMATHGVQAHAIAEDLADPEAPARLAAELSHRGIAVDALINNAGYGPRGGFVTTPWEEHRDFLQVMVRAPVDLAHRFLPGMVTRRYGRIVNISSLASFAPEQRGSMYGPAKRFMTSWTRALALELQSSGVHATAACPGFTYSEFHDVMGNRAHMDRLPTLLWMTSEEVARRSWAAVERGTPVVVLGAVNKSIAALCALLPASAVHSIVPRALRDRGSTAAFDSPDQ